MSRAGAAALACALTCGCIQDIQVGVDASSGALDADARPAELDAAEVADGGPVLDATEADATSTDGATDGEADGGVSAVTALRWAEMVLPPNTRSIDAIWGRAPDDVYAASSGGLVYHYAGTGDWTQVWRTTNNQGIRAMTGDATHLYLAGENMSWRLDATHTLVDTASFNSARQMHAIAAFGGGPTMLIGAEETTAGVLARWTGSTITEVHRPTMVRAVTSVFAAGGDRYYFGGSHGSIHGYLAGAIARELVSLPLEWDLTRRAQMNVRGMAQLGGRTYAVGGSHLVFVREGTAAVPVWNVVYRGDAPQAEELYALAGGDLPGGGVEGYAVGDAPSSGGIVRFDGTAWTPQNVSDQWVMRGIWRAHADLYFAVGYRRNGIDGRILRGMR